MVSLARQNAVVPVRNRSQWWKALTFAEPFIQQPPPVQSQHVCRKYQNLVHNDASHYHSFRRMTTRMTSSLPTPQVRPLTRAGSLPDPLPQGYKPGAAKSADEYAKLDAEDESLARWKASLGIVPGASGGEASGPKVYIQLWPHHRSIFNSGLITGDRSYAWAGLSNSATRDADYLWSEKHGQTRRHKEESHHYQGRGRIQVRIHSCKIRNTLLNTCSSVRITFQVNHSIISVSRVVLSTSCTNHTTQGARYIQLVKRAGVKG